jgi:hypothetical protein
VNHLLRCRCGALQGSVSHTGEATRGVCYCNDCQAYAHFLGRAADMLDKMGGTEIVATRPMYVTFTHGIEGLACMSLTGKGLLRWYASCCNTPIGNTGRDSKQSYVGLVRNCLEDPSRTLEESFGPVRMQVNTKNARGKPDAMRMSTFASILRFMAMMIRARLDGSHRNTPFFAADGRTPIRAPKVLTSAKLDRVMKAV